MNTIPANRRQRAAARLVQAGAILLCLLLASAANAQIVRSFQERASFDTTGDFLLIGNTLLTCEAGGTPDCASVQAGLVSGSNSRQMQYVNIDPAAGFDNSSSAVLQIPAGASVLYAGLYWGGRASPSDGDRDTIRFRPPGQPNYLTITSTQTDTITTQGTATARPYQGFADVTALVQAAGSGNYFVGDLTASLGNDGLGFYGGWSLFVVIEDPSQPFRRLSLFDGAVNISGTTTETVGVSGLLTPLAGTFTTRLGALVWEGDEGIVGDRFRLNGVDLSDPLNPVNNFWNSSITRLGTRISDKNPDFVNQLAVDINYIDASGILANGATTAEIEFVTDGDAYFPHVLAFAVDLFVPDLVTSLSKTAVDLNGGTLLPGDIVEYTISFENVGADGADRVVVTDTLPAGTSFVPGSLEIINNATGAPTGPQTDAAGDDLGEFDPVTNTVTFRVGTGATTSQGGLIASGESAAVRFRVQIDNDPSLYGQSITNLARVTHIGQTLTNLEFEGQADVTLPLGNPDISLDKTIVSGSPFAADGDQIQYLLVAVNTGDSVLSNVTIVDPGATLSNCSPSMPATLLPSQMLTCDAVYTVTQTDVDSGSYSNTASVSGQAANSAVFDDQDSAVADGPASNPDLSIAKTLSNAPDPIEADSELTYTVTATNTGNVTLTNVVVSDPMISPSSTTCPSVAPNDTCVLVGSYTVSQTDVDNGQIVNTASATSTQTPDPVEDGLTTPISQSPALAIAKALTNAPTPIQANSVLTYTVTATNTGNVTLTNVVVSDPLISPSSITCPSVAPNGTCVLVGSYTVSQTDVDSGQVVNTATAVSTQTPNPVEADLTTPITQSPALGITKTLTGAPNPIEANSVLTYTVTATNTGNLTLTNVVVSDPMIDPNSITCSTVAPGGTCVLVGTYTVNQTDIDNGEIVNTATAVSTQTPDPVEAELSTPIAQTPSLTIVKALVDPPETIAVDTVLTYTVTATNNGNVTLTNVVVSDPMIDPDSITCPSVGLGQTCVLTGTYVVTQDDIDNGQIVNIGTAVSEETPDPIDDELVTPVDQNPDLTLVKTLTSGPNPANVGDVLEYTMTATNSGNVTLQSVTINDPITTPSSITCTDLAPGDSCVLVGSYTVTPEDLEAGEVVNVATATGSVDPETELPEVSDDARVGVNPVIAVPVMGPLGLLVLILLMLATVALSGRARQIRPMQA